MTTAVPLYNTQKYNYTSEEGPSLTKYVGIDYAKCMSQNDTHVYTWLASWNLLFTVCIMIYNKIIIITIIIIPLYTDQIIKNNIITEKIMTSEYIFAKKCLAHSVLYTYTHSMY